VEPGHRGGRIRGVFSAGAVAAAPSAPPLCVTEQSYAATLWEDQAVNGSCLSAGRATWPNGSEHAVSLFGELLRTDRSPSRHGESTYAFLCRAAGPVWDQCRELIDGWLANYPDSDQPSIEGRLGSRSDDQFASAFWELYIHETYRRAGWDVEVEPEVPGVYKRPDFLFSKAGSRHYVEARCVFEGGDQGAQARLQSVYASVNKIDSGPFHLVVTPLVIGAKSPSTLNLRRDLELWLKELDPDSVSSSFGNENSTQFAWNHDDWRVQFRAIPRSPHVRHQSAERPIGAYIPAEATLVDDIGALRQALDEKGGRYGDLEAPLLIAVNVVRGFHDARDTVQALFGRVGLSLELEAFESEPRPVVIEPGYWGRANHPLHTHVAGILVAEGLHYSRVGQYVPSYWSHPWAEHPVDPLPCWGQVDLISSTLDNVVSAPPTTVIHDYFGLSEGWPIGEPFSRK